MISGLDASIDKKSAICEITEVLSLIFEAKDEIIFDFLEDIREGLNSISDQQDSIIDSQDLLAYLATPK